MTNATLSNLSDYTVSSPVLRMLLEEDALPSDCLDTLVRFAAHRGATDFYASAEREGYRISIRCDGSLQSLGEVPRLWAERVIGHAKVAAKLDASEHRRPQDGRVVVFDDSHPIDLRVSTMPTYFGEDLALRILDRRMQLMQLDRLGFMPSALRQVQSLINQPNGLVLVSGATGAGKTTTLYAILNELSDGTRKINTLEDPVEFDLPGIHQTAINTRIGLDFADLLTAVLRQDPDVIMVGEVRDAKTAVTAVRAAATGQLVLATLHAPRAVGAIHGMLGHGVSSQLLSGALRGVIAQHLLRRICAGCTRSLTRTSVLNVFDDVRQYLPSGCSPVLHQGRGCAECNASGYRKRTGVFEVLTCTPAIQNLIERNATPDAIQATAVREGMIPLRVAAKLAVAQGLTTLEEAMRAIDLRQ